MARSGPSSRCTSSCFFALDRVKVLAPQHPEWKGKEPFASAPQGRRESRAGRRRACASWRWHGHPRRHDHRGVREDRQAIGSPRRSTLRPSGATPRWSISRCSNCSPTCARTASRRSSSPAAASSSCGLGRRRSTASRPSRSIGSSIKTGVRDARRQAGARPAAGDQISSTTRPANRSASTSTSAGAPSPHSATPTATSRCCSGRRAAPAPALPFGPPHRRRARVGLRPRVAPRAVGHGLDEAHAKGWTVVNMKERLEGHLP